MIDLKKLTLAAGLLAVSAGRAAASPPIIPQCFKSAPAAVDGDIGVKMFVATLRAGGFRLVRTTYSPNSYFAMPVPPYAWGSALETFVNRDLERLENEGNPKGRQRPAPQKLNLRIDVGVEAGRDKMICYVVTGYEVVK
jgi:hypothetical protein